MARSLLILFALCWTAAAQNITNVVAGQKVLAGAVFSTIPSGGGGGGGFSPTNISGLAYYWDHNDFSVGQAVTNWVDKIQGLTFSRGAGSIYYATNTANGIQKSVDGDQLYECTEITLPSSYSIWAVFRSDDPTGDYKCVLGSSSDYTLLFGTKAGNLNMYDYGDNTISPAAANVMYDVVVANGTCYTNGAAALSFTGLNSQKLGYLFHSAGGYQLFGYVKFIGIWTNKTLTAQNASDLSTYSAAH